MDKNNNLTNLCIYAARYAHHRPTGCALQTVNAIKSVWNQLDDKTKKQLIQESHEATCCLSDWEHLRIFASKN
jgi:hypothetical protein